MSDEQPATATTGGSTRTLVLGLVLTLLVLLGAGVVAVRGVADGVVRGQPDGQPPTGDPGLAEQAQQPRLEDRPEPTDAGPLPEVALEAFEGDGEVEPGAYRGTPLVVNFWATWCPPCVEEMPAFQEVAEAGQGSFALLGVNVQDDRDKAAALVDSLGITYDLAVDHDGSYFEGVSGFGMPTTLLVDPQGEIHYRHTGPLDAEGLVELLDERLGVEVSL